MSFLKSKITLFAFSFLLALGLSLSLQSLLATWTPPTDTPPYGNVPAPINEGITDQVKSGGLGILGNFSVGIYDNIAGTQNTLNVNVYSGNVGIGTNQPHSPAPNIQPGNIDVNDIYVRSVGTTGKWLSASVGVWEDITSDTESFKKECEHKMQFNQGMSGEWAIYNNAYFYPTVVADSYIKVFDWGAGNGLLTVESSDKTDIYAGTFANYRIKTYRKCQ
jgi:hypothetical protein